MNKLLTAKSQPLRFENGQNVLVCVKRLSKVYKKHIALRKSHGNYEVVTLLRKNFEIIKMMVTGHQFI